MPRVNQIEVRVRLVIEQPVRGVVHSLQDKKNQPVDAKASIGGKALTFEFPIRVGAGPKFYGEHVRSQGAERRFVYIAVGQQAGDGKSCWDRRMKIDIHDLSPALLQKARKGMVLEGSVKGTGKDGTPACASVQVKSWRAV